MVCSDGRDHEITISWARSTSPVAEKLMGSETDDLAILLEREDFPTQIKIGRALTPGQQA
jgi:hypothetical protein